MIWKKIGDFFDLTPQQANDVVWSALFLVTVLLVTCWVMPALFVAVDLGYYKMMIGGK